MKRTHRTRCHSETQKWQTSLAQPMYCCHPAIVGHSGPLGITTDHQRYLGSAAPWTSRISLGGGNPGLCLGWAAPRKPSAPWGRCSRFPAHLPFQIPVLTPRAPRFSTLPPFLPRRANGANGDRADGRRDKRHPQRTHKIQMLDFS